MKNQGETLGTHFRGTFTLWCTTGRKEMRRWRHSLQLLLGYMKLYHEELSAGVQGGVWDQVLLKTVVIGQACEH